MSLNYRLLQAAISAGATSTDLPTALRQALVLGGATPTTSALPDLWSSFLAAQGYSTGSTNDRLMAYLISKGYTTGSLTDRLLASATAGDLFSTTYDILNWFEVGDTGDAWDPYDQANTDAASNKSAVATVTGLRSSINLVSAGGAICWDGDSGLFLLHDHGQDRYFNLSSALGSGLDEPFCLVARAVWYVGFIRLVCVAPGAPNHVLFDIRVGDVVAGNPGSVSGLIQDAQANIAAVTGPSAPAAGTPCTVVVNRLVAGGDATVTVDGVSGTITAAAETGVPSLRYAETYGPAAYKWRLGRSVYRNRGATAQEIANAVLWVEEAYAGTPAANRAVLEDAAASGITLSNGNLTATNGTAAWMAASFTVDKCDDKWSATCTFDSGDFIVFGVTTDTSTMGTYPGSGSASWGYYSNNGQQLHGGVGSAFGATWAAGDEVKIELDATACTLEAFRMVAGNWVSQGTVDLLTLASPLDGTYSFCVGVYNGAATVNAGQTTFTVTSGFNVGVY